MHISVNFDSYEQKCLKGLRDEILRCPAEPVEPEDKGPAAPAGVDPELLAKILSKSGDGSPADESVKM